MQLQAGDILLFKAEKDFLSKIIAWGTNSKYSHVAVCVSPEMNLAIEALTRGGVRARGLDIVPDVEEADITSPGDIARSMVVDLVKG